jgi:hypothetical protein
MPELAGQSVEDTLAQLIREKRREAGSGKREANKENRKGRPNGEQAEAAAARRAKEASLEVLKEVYSP